MSADKAFEESDYKIISQERTVIPGAVFFTLTSSLFNIRWVRRHYDKLAKTGRSVAFFLEKLHK